MSRMRMQRRLRELEQRPRPARAARRSTWDLAYFTVEELEAMVPLAEKYDAAGDQVVWSPAELAVFDRLAEVEQRCRSGN